VCAGALAWSQLSRLVIGAHDEQRGFMSKNLSLHPKTEIVSGIMETECSALIREFFRSKR